MGYCVLSSQYNTQTAVTMYSLLVLCILSSISCEDTAGSSGDPDLGSSADPDLSKVQFLLWTGHNRFKPSHLELSLESIKSSHWMEPNQWLYSLMVGTLTAMSMERGLPRLT